MAYTDLELLRKEIADDYKYAFDVQTGDGQTTVFKLSHDKIKDESYQVFVANNLQEETTDYTIDLERGLVTFVTAPAEDDEVEVKYDYSVFSDTELNEFLSLDSNVLSAALHCINILLVDSARRFDYASGQTEMKPSQVFDNLMRLREELEKRASKVGYGNPALIDRSNRFYDDETEEETDLSRADLGDTDNE